MEKMWGFLSLYLVKFFGLCPFVSSNCMFELTFLHIIITEQWKSPNREQASIVSLIPGIWTIDSGITVAALAEES